MMHGILTAPATETSVLAKLRVNLSFCVLWFRVGGFSEGKLWYSLDTGTLERRGEKTWGKSQSLLLTANKIVKKYLKKMT
jgi:hypothetical protein